MNGPDQPQAAIAGGEETLSLLHNLSTLLARLAPDSSQDLNPSRKGTGSAHALRSEDAVDEEDEEVTDNMDHLTLPPRQATRLSPLALDPRSDSIEDDFNDVERSCSKIKLGAQCGFPKNDGASFNKDDRLHVGHLRRIHKATKVAMKLTLLACQRHQAAYNELEDVTTALLFTMRLVLDARDEIWVRRHHGEEAFNAFTVLENSSLSGDRRQRLIDAITIAGLGSRRDQVQKAGRVSQPHRPSPALRGRGRGDGKSRPNITRSHGAGSSAHQN